MILSEICVKRPVFATVLSLVLVTIGAIFFTKLPIRSLPDIDQPVISVSAYYDGADPQYMEQEVTNKIEKVLRTVKNLDTITSSSSMGSSDVTIIFKLSANIEVALNDVRSKIADISGSFPQGMSIPSVSKMSGDNRESFWISISSDKFNRMELTRIVKEYLQTPLEKLESVARARIIGDQSYTMMIEPSPLKMFQYKISPIDIETAITQQNKNYPAGVIKTTDKEFVLRLNGALKKVEDFENIILSSENKHILKLRDVAKVYLGPSEEHSIIRYNGNKTIAIGLIKQSKANVLDLSKEARAEVAKVQKILPNGINVEVMFDEATSVKSSIDGIFKAVLESLILVVIITYLFLASIRLTLIPAITIPISLIATFSVMYMLGFSINTFTLLAIILAIGLVVDDAIVMLENIFRHHENGETPMQATKLAIKEVSFAIVAMTITLASVFLPIGFIDGFLGKLFIEFAWTLAFCVLFSGFVALTLTPMMASRMITNRTNQLPWFLIKFDQWVKLVQIKYDYYLHYVFDNKKKFLLFSSSSIILLILGFTFVGKSFAPQEDNGFLYVQFVGPEGASIERTEKTFVAVEQILNNFKGILGYFEFIGCCNGGAFIPLKDWSIRSKSQEEIKDQLNEKFSKLPGMTVTAVNPPTIGSGGANDAVEFNLQSGMEYGDLDKLSAEFIKQLKENPVFTNVTRDYNPSKPTLDVTINREKAYIYGLDMASIGSTIKYLMAGVQVGSFQLGNDVYDVLLRYNKKQRSDISDIRQILVRNNQKVTFPLDSVATLSEKTTVNSYEHYNNSKAIKISSDLSSGYKITDAIKVVNKIADKLIDKSTTKLEYLGQIKDMEESSGKTAMTFMFAMIFIYLVLSAQFESFTDPLLILASVPFSITGGVLALLLSGNTLNIYSNIGLITLIGLITKNAIMIVEFANQLKEKGIDVEQAIKAAAALRLRPILMTTMATVFGALPLVFATGAGSAARNSIGLVIVGGMLVGSAFTLFVIPVLYQTFKRKNNFRQVNS